MSKVRPVAPGAHSPLPHVEAAADAARDLVLSFASDKVHLGQLRHAVAEVARPRGRLVRARAELIVALFEVAQGEDWIGFAQEMRTRVTALVRDEQLTVGVGGPRARIDGLGTALLQSEQAALFGPVLHGYGRVISFVELGPSRFVLGRPIEEIRELRDRMLGRLAEEGGSEEELLQTLEVYLRLSANINAVARALFLHRNTVRYRLQRIAEIIGHDLKDPDVRLTLQLAILAQRALARLERQQRRAGLVALGPASATMP